MGSSPIGHPKPPRDAAPRKWAAPALAPAASAADAFEAAVRSSIEHVHRHRPGALSRTDPEFLHQVRVGLRRLRVALRAFRGLAKRRGADAFQARLARDLRRLGPARDWDVIFSHGSRLNAKARALRERAWHDARALLASDDFPRLLDEVLAWAQSQPWRARARPGEPAQAFGRDVLRRFRRNLARTAREADWSSEHDLHRLRIRAKRLRYAADMFGGEGSAMVSLLRPLQQALGDLRDMSVRRTLLRKAGMSLPNEDKTRRKLFRRVERAWKRYEAGRGAVRG